MIEFERRKFRRSPVKLALSYSRVAPADESSHRGYTLNVSPGGLYFRTVSPTPRQGNLLHIELSIPPTAGILEFGGKLSGFAKVLRAQGVGDSHAGRDLPSNDCEVAVEFCQKPKLHM